MNILISCQRHQLKRLSVSLFAKESFSSIVKNGKISEPQLASPEPTDAINSYQSLKTMLDSNYSEPVVKNSNKKPSNDKKLSPADKQMKSLKILHATIQSLVELGQYGDISKYIDEYLKKGCNFQSLQSPLPTGSPATTESVNSFLPIEKDILKLLQKAMIASKKPVDILKLLSYGKLMEISPLTEEIIDNYLDRAMNTKNGWLLATKFLNEVATYDYHQWNPEAIQRWYMTAIHLCHKYGKWRTAVDMLTYLHQHELPLTSKMLCMVIQTCYKDESYKAMVEANSIFQYLVQQTYYCDYDTYLILLRGLNREKMYEEAEKVWIQLTSDTSVTGFHQLKQFNRKTAEEIKWFPLTDTLFSCYLTTLCGQGSYDRAMEVYQIVYERFKNPMNSYIALSGGLKHLSPPMADKYFQLLSSQQVKLSQRHIVTHTRNLLSNKEYSQAVEYLVAEIVSPEDRQLISAKLWHEVCKVMIEQGLMEEAIRVYHSMKEYEAPDDLKGSRHWISKIFVELDTLGSWEEAYHLAKSEEDILTEESYLLLLKCLFNNNQFSLAISELKYRYLEQVAVHSSQDLPSVSTEVALTGRLKFSLHSCSYLIKRLVHLEKCELIQTIVQIYIENLVVYYTAMELSTASLSAEMILQLEEGRVKHLKEVDELFLFIYKHFESLVNSSTKYSQAILSLLKYQQSSYSSLMASLPSLAPITAPVAAVAVGGGPIKTTASHNPFLAISWTQIKHILKCLSEENSCPNEVLLLFQYRHHYSDYIAGEERYYEITMKACELQGKWESIIELFDELLHEKKRLSVNIFDRVIEHLTTIYTGTLEASNKSPARGLDKKSLSSYIADIYQLMRHAKISPNAATTILLLKYLPFDLKYQLQRDMVNRNQPLGKYMHQAAQVQQVQQTQAAALKGTPVPQQSVSPSAATAIKG